MVSHVVEHRYGGFVSCKKMYMKSDQLFQQLEIFLNHFLRRSGFWTLGYLVSDPQSRKCKIQATARTEKGAGTVTATSSKMHWPPSSVKMTNRCLLLTVD